MVSFQASFSPQNLINLIRIQEVINAPNPRGWGCYRWYQSKVLRSQAAT